MENENKYKEALDRAWDLYSGPTANVVTRAYLEQVFPELRDKKIVNRIRLCLDECVHSDVIRDYERDEVLSYLEKRLNHQKPAERDSEEVFDKIDNSFRKGREIGFREGVESVNVKPAEWSEEDKVMLNRIAYRLKDWDNIKAQQGYQDNYASQSPVKWVESLPDRFNLLPKQEQKPIDMDFVSDWLRKHIKTYLNSEYNEFHQTVEYDGNIDVERLIEDLKKAIEQQP